MVKEKKKKATPPKKTKARLEQEREDRIFNLIAKKLTVENTIEGISFLAMAFFFKSVGLTALDFMAFHFGFLDFGGLKKSLEEEANAVGLTLEEAGLAVAGGPVGLAIVGAVVLKRELAAAQGNSKLEIENDIKVLKSALENSNALLLSEQNTLAELLNQEVNIIVFTEKAIVSQRIALLESVISQIQNRILNISGGIAVKETELRDDKKITDAERQKLERRLNNIAWAMGFSTAGFVRWFIKPTDAVEVAQLAAEIIPG